MADSMRTECGKVGSSVSNWPGRVLAIVVGLAIGVVLVSGALKYADLRGSRDLARAVITQANGKSLVSCLKQFRAEKDSFPEVLESLVPSCAERVPIDGWRRPFEYRVELDGSVTIMSLGADGRVGGKGVEADLWWRVDASTSSEGVGALPGA